MPSTQVLILLIGGTILVVFGVVSGLPGPAQTGYHHDSISIDLVV